MRTTTPLRSLLTVALLVATSGIAAAQTVPQTVPVEVQAQDASRLIRLCYVDSFTYVWDLSFDRDTGALTGSVEVTVPSCGRYDVVGQVVGNDVTVTATNPNAGDDADCTDGAGCSDFFTYTGLRFSLGGKDFSFDGTWTNPCNGLGTFTGVGSHGTCVMPREPALGSPLTATPASVSSAASGQAAVSLEGYGLSSHPNPFTAAATIVYTLPEQATIRLAVYDVLGREVAVLVDEERKAGTYSVQWEAETSLPAGAYLYRLTAGMHTETRQMMLVR